MIDDLNHSDAVAAAAAEEAKNTDDEFGDSDGAGSW